MRQVGGYGMLPEMVWGKEAESGMRTKNSGTSETPLHMHFLNQASLGRAEIKVKLSGQWGGNEDSHKPAGTFRKKLKLAWDSRKR